MHCKDEICWLVNRICFINMGPGENEISYLNKYQNVCLVTKPGLSRAHDLQAVQLSPELGYFPLKSLL